MYTQKIIVRGKDFFLPNRMVVRYIGEVHMVQVHLDAYSMMTWVGKWIIFFLTEEMVSYFLMKKFKLAYGFKY